MSALESTATGIVRRLRDAGHTAYFAGGCVRDMLRRVDPKDYDIATSARPEQIQALFPRTIAIGAHFGVISVLEGGAEYQVATFRADGLYIDGRHPSSIEKGTALEDAQRRDFTVNGLFYDPIEQEMAGLAHETIRCPRAPTTVA